MYYSFYHSSLLLRSFAETLCNTHGDVSEQHEIQVILSFDVFGYCIVTNNRLQKSPIRIYPNKNCREVI